MNGVWQIQDAKNQLSEVIARALKQKKKKKKKKKKFRSSPLAGVEIDVTRDKSLPRKGIEP